MQILNIDIWETFVLIKNNLSLKSLIFLFFLVFILLINIYGIFNIIKKEKKNKNFLNNYFISNSSVAYSSAATILVHSNPESNTARHSEYINNNPENPNAGIQDSLVKFARQQNKLNPNNSEYSKSLWEFKYNKFLDDKRKFKFLTKRSELANQEYEAQVLALMLSAEHNIDDLELKNHVRNLQILIKNTNQNRKSLKLEIKEAEFVFLRWRRVGADTLTPLIQKSKPVIVESLNNLGYPLFFKIMETFQALSSWEQYNILFSFNAYTILSLSLGIICVKYGNFVISRYNLKNTQPWIYSIIHQRTLVGRYILINNLIIILSILILQIFASYF